jgi:peptide/nickel transport system substrate-binding protein
VTDDSNDSKPIPQSPDEEPQADAIEPEAAPTPEEPAFNAAEPADAPGTIDAAGEPDEPASPSISADATDLEALGDLDDESLDHVDWDALRAAYALQVRPDEEFPSIGAQRIGRRGFLVGLAAAGLPIAGLVRVMENAGGGDSPSVAAPSYQQGAATPAASPSASPISTPLAGATPQASPQASPEPVNPLGKLQVIRDQAPRYAETPVKGGTLRMMLTLPDNFDFNPVALEQDYQLMATYLDPLVWIDDQTMEPKPGIAESWDISKDGKTITFNIRDDISWHDGDPLTAEDVAFSLLVYRDATDSDVRNLFVTLNDAKVVDKRTVEVQLSTPDANFIPNAGSQFVFKKDAFEKFWEDRPEGQRSLSGYDWEKNPPIGTGPWKYAARTDSSITFSRNDEYWFADPPHFDELVFTWKSNPADRIAAWKSGEVDLLWPIKPSEVAQVNDTASFLYAANAPIVMFAAFNFDNQGAAVPDLLKDVRVRQALSLAIDRRAYASSAFLDFVDITAAGTFPQPWLRDEALLNPARSRQAARDLLNEAGFTRKKDGTTIMPDGVPFILDLIVRADARFEMRLALRSIKEDWAALGIGLEIEELDDATFNDRWTSTYDWDLIAFSYQTYPGFTDFDLYGSNWDIRINPQGWNPGGYHNSDADAAIRGALGAKTLDALESSVQDLQVAANDDLFGLWLGFPQDLILVHPDVLGFQPTMNWQTWQTRKLWRRPAGAAVPAQVVLPSS